LNQELQLSLSSYIQQNARLNVTLIAYAEVNDQLNATLLDLSGQNTRLEAQIDLYAKLNANLNQTALSFSQDVDRLNTVNGELINTNKDLTETVGALSNETAELSAANDGLNATVRSLEAEVVDLVAEVDRIDHLANNLATIVSFLNETAVLIDESMVGVTDFLAQQIDRNRRVAINSLRNFYKQRTSFWSCDFREHFLADPFVQDRNAPVGSASFTAVMDYIEERVLSDLCLSRIDFVVYLAIQTTGTIPPVGASYNEIVRAVGSYTDLAMAYYFPLSGRDGLTTTIWGEAHYNCDNLPPILRYSHTI